MKTNDEKEQQKLSNENSRDVEGNCVKLAELSVGCHLRLCHLEHCWSSRNFHNHFHRRSD